MTIKNISFLLTTTVMLTTNYIYTSEQTNQKSTSNSELVEKRIQLLIATNSLMINIESKKPTVIEHQPKQQNIIDLLSLASLYVKTKYQEEHPIINPVMEGTLSILQYNCRAFNRQPIYFGKTSEGYHYCAPIEKHEKNPDFDKVTLALFQGNSIFFNPFKIIGTYSDQSKRQLLKNRITQDGGLWCPEQNAFIGGTRDKSICHAFADFEKEYKKPTLFKKLKKIITDQYK